MEIVGMSFSVKPFEAYYVPCPLDFEGAKKIVQKFKEAFANPNALKVGHNIKFDMKILNLYDVHVAPPIYDTMVAHYVADAHIRHKMDIMAETYLGYTPVPITDLIGRKGKNQLSMQDIDLERIKEYAAEDADVTLQLKTITDKMIKEVQSEELANNLEFPLIHVLTDMECEGINLDVPFLTEYSRVIKEELFGIRESIYKCCGTEFNIDSPKQLGDILFEHMK